MSRAEDKIKTVKRLYEARAILNKQIIAAGKMAWPVGGVVHFEKWGGVIDAEVRAIGY